MEDTIAVQIAAFREARHDLTGGAGKKLRIVECLEDQLSVSCVLDLFFDLIADPDEDNMVRLEALKSLQLWEPPSEQTRARVGRRIASVLLIESDALVQQWVAIAAENFVSVPEVFAAVSHLLAVPAADLDVRHNCLAAVKSLGPTEPVRELLMQLSDDSALGMPARRILNQWADGV